jgi:hypothetical protein
MLRQLCRALIIKHMINFFASPLGLWIRVVPLFFLSLYLLRSGIQPDGSEPRKWYDRAIRIAGALIFGAGALFGSARILRWAQ